MSILVRRLVVGAAIVLSATLASAQPAPPPGPPPAGQHSGPTPADESDRFRQELRLRPDQEGSLQAFVAAMQPKPGQAEHFRDEAAREATLPTPQRLDAMLARMDEMRGVLVARMAATKAFYAQLSPGQRVIFDQLPPPAQGPRSPPPTAAPR
jgi:hypothetical protein